MSAVYVTPGVVVGMCCASWVTTVCAEGGLVVVPGSEVHAISAVKRVRTARRLRVVGVVIMFSSIWFRSGGPVCGFAALPGITVNLRSQTARNRVTADHSQSPRRVVSL